MTFVDLVAQLKHHLADLAVLGLSILAGWAATWIIRKETGKPAIYAFPVIGASLVVAAWTVAVMPQNGMAIVTFLLGWALMMLATVDAVCFRLPDAITLPLTAFGLVASFWMPNPQPLNHLIGAAAGFFAFYCIAILYSRVRGREGLGLGDAKLVASAGAWLGWIALPYVVLIGCAGAFAWIGIAVLRRGRQALHEQIPFGVPLCFAFWIVWLYGPP